MPIVQGPQCYKHSDPLLRKVLKVPITQRENTSASKSPEFKMQKMGAVTDKSLYLTSLGC